MYKKIQTAKQSLETEEDEIQGTKRGEMGCLTEQNFEDLEEQEEEQQEEEEEEGI